MARLHTSVEDLASRGALLADSSLCYRCPKCWQDVSFTLKELEAHVREGATEGFRKKCQFCKADLNALLDREEVDGRQVIRIIDLQLYPRKGKI